jgi:hypothetical protein
LIAIMTEIPRFYYEAVRELKDRDIEFLTLAMDDEIPSIVSVVLTSEEEREQIDFPEVAGSTDIKAAVDECLRIESGLGTGYKNLILGIDPGLKPGFAVLGDGKVAHAELLGSPEDILKVSKRALDTYSGKSVTFRVGKGGGVYKARVLKILQQNFDFPIEVVDESNTTPLLGRGAAVKDIIAAVNIALKQGRILKKKIEVYPTDGEIRNLQKDSRIISGNITINKDLAKRVAKGELTIEEAIEIQRGE